MSVQNNWIERGLGRKVVVTGRDYQLVKEALHIPNTYFTPGLRVLSVGEGLSNFSRLLRVKFDVNATAVDPIYALRNQVLKTSSKQLDKILRKAYQNQVEFIIPLGQTSEKVSLPEKRQMVAGDTYQLPFRDESFDRVLTNKMVEHVDLSKALPELLRVLNVGGELRIAGMTMTAQPESRRLNPYVISFSGSVMDFGYSTDGTLGADKALEWLISQHTLNAYVVLDRLPGRSEVRDGYKVYEAGVLIIRNDDKIPQVAPLSQDNIPLYFDKEKFPYLGALCKIESGLKQATSSLPLLQLKTHTD